MKKEGGVCLEFLTRRDAKVVSMGKKLAKPKGNRAPLLLVDIGDVVLTALTPTRLNWIGAIRRNPTAWSRLVPTDFPVVAPLSSCTHSPPHNHSISTHIVGWLSSNTRFHRARTHTLFLPLYVLRIRMTWWYGRISVHVTTHRNLTGRSCFILRDPVNFGNKIHSSFAVSDHAERFPCAYEGWTFREKPAKSRMSYARSLPTVGQLPKATTRCFSLTLMYRTTAILMEHSPFREDNEVVDYERTYDSYYFSQRRLPEYASRKVVAFIVPISQRGSLL